MLADDVSASLLAGKAALSQDYKALTADSAAIMTSAISAIYGEASETCFDATVVLWRLRLSNLCRRIHGLEVGATPKNQYIFRRATNV